MDLEKRKNIASQMATAANQLDILAAMLTGHRPDKAAEIRGASDMLAEWECEILNDTADERGK